MITELDPLSPEEALPGVVIHPRALVSRQARLGTGVRIGPGAVIGPEVELGDDVRVGPGAVVDGRTKVGKSTSIWSYATVGAEPQDLKYAGEKTDLIIGEGNQIREYVNISIGTEGGGGQTVIGNNNLFMVYPHIAHDCHIGNDCIFANGIQIAGHVTIQDHVVFGGMSGGHQFCQFGEYSMVGAGAIVVQDVPPFCMVQGDRAKINGLNVVGLRRAGIRGEKMSAVKQMFRLLYKDNLTVEEARERIEKEVPHMEQKTTFLAFLNRSERGICR